MVQDSPCREAEAGLVSLVLERMIAGVRCSPLISPSVQEKTMKSPLRRFVTVVLLSLSIHAIDWASWIPCDGSTETIGSVSKLYAQRQTSRTQTTGEQSIKNAKQDSWQVIFIGEQRIGYVREKVREILVDGKTVIRSTSDTHMTLKRLGQTLRMQMIFTTDEAETGRMLSFEFEQRNPPAGTVKTVGRVVDKNDGTGQQQLLLETTIAWRVKKKQDGLGYRYQNSRVPGPAVAKITLEAGRKTKIQNIRAPTQ